MKKTIQYILAGCFLAIPFIAWLPARFWVACGYLWCLEVFPARIDSLIYTVASPYLDSDISVAAGQMEFMEIWLSSVVIMEIVILPVLCLLLKKYMKDDPGIW